MNNTIWFFDNIDVFQILCPHSYKNFADNHIFNNFDKGDFVYFEEDSANKIFLISSGKVKIGYNTESGDEVITSILTKGQIFGEKAILGEDKREEFAQAIENGTSICVISLDMMYEMLRQNNDFSLKIYKFIGYRFKKLERRLQILLFKDAKTRLLEFIKDLGDEYGYNNIVSGDRIIRHPYTQKEIATLIGTSRPTLNILLNELQKENVLIFQRREIILKK